MTEHLQGVIRKVRERTSEGDLDGALTVLDHAMANASADRELYVRALAPIGAAIANSLGNHELSYQYCEVRLQFEPKNPMALYAMADNLISRGAIEEAEQFATMSREAGLETLGVNAAALIELINSRFPGLTDKQE